MKSEHLTQQSFSFEVKTGFEITLDFKIIQFPEITNNRISF